jgi:hypothetical protein
VTYAIGVLAVVVAVTAAVRSTWSPCGLSMLSTITPLAEQGRGYRFRSTSLWFLAGALVGGAALGSLAAFAAATVGALGISSSGALAAGAVLAVVAAAIDAGLVGPPLPHHRRQVNELWLSRYRSWVYGSGFGLQIGSGLATYIMTAAVYLTLALAALTGTPGAAFTIVMVFSTVRGAAIFLGARLTTPERLAAFHRRFDAMGEPVRRGVIVVELVVATVAATFVFGAVGLLVTAAVAAAIYWRGVHAAAPQPDLRGLADATRSALALSGQVDDGGAGRPDVVGAARSRG